jgi:hypothetical protein
MFTEFEMGTALLFVLGLGCVSLGATVTYLLASRIPQPVLQRAQDHGRFAGLRADDRSGGSGKRATSGVKLGNQVINAC